MRAIQISAWSMTLLTGVYAIGAVPADSVEIPLKEVWAYRMEGTRDINEFGTRDAADSSVQKALVEIRRHWRDNEGMAVSGEGGEALKNFRHLLATDEERNILPATSPVSLAFYSRGTGSNLQVTRVARVDSTFTIQFSSTPYNEAISYSQLALIPVGTLEAGKYEVVVEEVPTAKGAGRDRRENKKTIRDRVSGSFAFIVQGGR